MDNLRYKSVFDIIGPVMVGPSSSHTAGAARIGKIVRSIFGELPDHLEIHLYESFAKTYRGHGTDIALVAGVLGMDPDDERLPLAPQLAYDQGMEVSYVPHLDVQASHPNTARLICRKGDKKMTITGISLGGGLIKVTELNGFEVSISMGMPTFVIVQQDVPGVIAKVTGILMDHDINVAQMTVTRAAKGDKAIMIIEVDTTKQVNEAAEAMKEIPELIDANFFI
ncbi:L-serine ammonia-lyase, iron-sulfur-dependent subunit beta [Lactovum miscens]|uniref:L-serine deaminase n=1 Tax=Lactovum miscens TaxID=190387 RepID=A0A841C7B4_9LACT|nr:L-serine ammonia-lyase, iron-sulfur-dependent subunit beta [Lactovum miscens]MBB5887441.1 L-serine dehydratase [Lactovum miscens]